MIKNLIACVSLLLIVSLSHAQVRIPAPSPTQTIKQDFGIGNVELSYSRPGIKNRKIGTDLAPYGKVWRTGANQATTLTFSDSVTIGGTRLAPGKYGLLSIPEKNQWTLIITRQTDVTSPAAYKQEMDAVRVEVKPTTLKESVETLTMQFANIKPTSMDLELMWGNVALALPITTDVDTKIMADINRSLQDSRPYYQAALYYMESGRDLNQAITWFDKAIEQNPNAFWIYHQKANALARLGKKEEARTAARKSMDLAREAKNDDYVQLNQKLMDSIK